MDIEPTELAKPTDLNHIGRFGLVLTKKKVKQFKNENQTDLFLIWFGFDTFETDQN